MPRGRPKKKPETDNMVIEPTNILDNQSNNYNIQGKTKTISAMCRQSISIKGNYYTFEYKEERELPLTDSINLTKEKDDLWYSVNSEVDNQINNLIDWLEQREN